MPKEYGFYFDPKRCLQCRACEIACQQWKGLPTGTVKLRRVQEVTTGTFPEVTRKFFSLSCRHCAQAPCAAACPAQAISRRDDGIVLVDSSKCDGCRKCLNACPFDIPQFGTDGKLQKCDMCMDRIEQGQPPACTSTCPTQALRWSTIRESSNPSPKDPINP